MASDHRPPHPVSPDSDDLDGGGQHTPEYRAINPMGAVPALVLPGEDDAADTVLTQSLAILEWMEETHPSPPLLPAGAAARARVRALCAITAADTHPLVVPRVQKYLTDQGWDLERRTAWNAHWFGQGLQGYEAQVGPGPFVAGIAPGMADICLASHVAGAERFGLSLSTAGAIFFWTGVLSALSYFVAVRIPSASVW